MAQHRAAKQGFAVPYWCRSRVWVGAERSRRGGLTTVLGRCLTHKNIVTAPPSCCLIPPLISRERSTRAVISQLTACTQKGLKDLLGYFCACRGGSDRRASEAAGSTLTRCTASPSSMHHLGVRSVSWHEVVVF